jgi:tRNA threonylcarbamoyladenosine biosynthesis protein TsaE
MASKREHLSKSIQETKDIAEKIISAILLNKSPRRGAMVVGLSGDLGAGKTTLVKAIAKLLGIKDKLSSPTFVIMKRYPLKKCEGYENFFHLDAYRLEKRGDLENLEWKEIIQDPKNLVFIEWPENVKGAIPDGTIYIQISHRGEKERHFRMV